MAEFCIDCLNKITALNWSPEKYLISKEPGLCEECGELKPIVIRVNRRYIVAELFHKRIENPEKEIGK